MSVAACLIVRNGVATIERALESFRPHVDEICVYDTGSTDGTLDLLERLIDEPGAPIRVQHGTWRDDYAEARNRSFAMATSEYLAWFDDDEVLEGGAHLRPLLTESRPDILCVRRVDVWNRASIMSTLRLRIVRASLGARWAGPIHETLGSSLPHDVTAVAREAISPALARVIHHPVRVTGRHRHRALVERHVADYRYLSFYLGRHLLADDHDYARACEAFATVVEGDSCHWSERFMILEALKNLSYCHHLLGDDAAARDAERKCRLLRRTLMHDKFISHCAELERTYPIAPDDPLWALYADDPRTADSHERRAA